VRRAEVGEAWIIAAGRSLHPQVAETPYSPHPAELPTPHRDGLAVVEERPPWVVDLPDQEPAAATAMAGELLPPRPVLPPPSPELPRLRVQLATAVREGDELALRRVLKRAARVAPTWDAEAELAALTAARRRRRNQPPAWLGWLIRIAHAQRRVRNDQGRDDALRHTGRLDKDLPARRVPDERRAASTSRRARDVILR
jgi:hypothetical protein